MRMWKVTFRHVYTGELHTISAKGISVSDATLRARTTGSHVSHTNAEFVSARSV